MMRILDLDRLPSPEQVGAFAGYLARIHGGGPAARFEVLANVLLRRFPEIIDQIDRLNDSE
jgi:hypothetical protein